MVSIPGLYFVIACDDLARFVRPDPEDGLHTVGIVDLAKLERDEANMPDPPGPAWLEQNRFVPRLARRIGEDFAVDLFTHLVLVAAPAVLQELTSLIDAPTTASLHGTLARDLMTVPDLELWPHLLPWLHPPEADTTPTVSCHKQ